MKPKNPKNTSPSRPTQGAAILATCLVALLLSTSPGVATAGASDTYVASGTVVAEAGTPGLDGGKVFQADAAGFGEDGSGGGGIGVAKGVDVADSGAVVCNKSSSAPSVGGGCVPFGEGNSILVQDDTQGARVAFQVCIDNDGNGICTFQPGAGGCADDLYFSHADDGSFDNPLGPLPTGFRPGCPGGDWDGYVVLLCEGVHSEATPHSHAAPSGTITPVGHGLGTDGTFCGAPEPQGKVYTVT